MHLPARLLCAVSLTLSMLAPCAARWLYQLLAGPNGNISTALLASPPIGAAP